MRKRNKLMAVMCMVFMIAGGIMATAGVASAFSLDFSNLLLTNITFTGTGPIPAPSLLCRNMGAMTSYLPTKPGGVPA